MRRLLIALIILSALSFFSCQKSADKKIVDFQNREIKLNTKEIKMVSLVGGLTEWIYKLKQDDKLIGVGKEYREEFVGNLPVVGSFFDIDTLQIKELKPNVVLASTFLPKHYISWLEENNISVVLFTYPTDLEDMYKALDLLGAIFNDKELTDKAIKDFKTELKNILASSKANNATAYFSLRFNDEAGEDEVASHQHLMGKFLEMASYDNIGKDALNMVMDREDIIKINPEYIFIDELQKQAFVNTPPYNAMPAVVQGKVIGLNMKSFTAFSPRYLQLVKQITEASL
ncbi:MAG: ABC transporter substrate-binding protein [Bacteroidales bacterium]|nr:ABC transporter substrate-binding protein [Bacteroidales bacterium]